jgi:hypothetical protein
LVTRMSGARRNIRKVREFNVDELPGLDYTSLHRVSQNRNGADGKKSK